MTSPTTSPRSLLKAQLIGSVMIAAEQQKVDIATEIVERVHRQVRDDISRLYEFKLELERDIARLKALGGDK